MASKSRSKGTARATRRSTRRGSRASLFVSLSVRSPGGFGAPGVFQYNFVHPCKTIFLRVRSLEHTAQCAPQDNAHRKALPTLGVSHHQRSLRAAGGAAAAPRGGAAARGRARRCARSRADGRRVRRCALGARCSAWFVVLQRLGIRLGRAWASHVARAHASCSSASVLSPGLHLGARRRVQRHLPQAPAPPRPLNGSPRATPLLPTPDRHLSRLPCFVPC